MDSRRQISVDKFYQSLQREFLVSPTLILLLLRFPHPPDPPLQVKSGRGSHTYQEYLSFEAYGGITAQFGGPFSRTVCENRGTLAPVGSEN